MTTENTSHYQLLKSPGKINLFLDVHGPREDGFHDLTSVVVFLDLFDELKVQIEHGNSYCELTSSSTDIPTDHNNLVYQAWESFQKKTGLPIGLKCRLFKKIPPASGLGAGSGNAMKILTFLNDQCGKPLNDESLIGIGASIGSDCPMFIDNKPKIIRGRGERLEYLSEKEQGKLQGLKVMVFRPEFGISTPWAFRYFKKFPEKFTEKSYSEEQLQKWVSGQLSLDALLHNTLEAPAFSKYLVIGLLVDKLRKKHHIPSLLAGSGSTSFSIFSNEEQKNTIISEVKNYYGNQALCFECTFL